MAKGIVQTSESLVFWGNRTAAYPTFRDWISTPGFDFLASL
jgi:hypothetical protein